MLSGILSLRSRLGRPAKASAASPPPFSAPEELVDAAYALMQPAGPGPAPRDPESPEGLNRRAVAHVRQARFSEAEQLLKLAVALVEPTADDPVALCVTLLNLGTLERLLSKPRQSRNTLTRAIAEAQEHLPENDIRRAWAEEQLGDLDAVEGTTVAALYRYRRALAIKAAAGVEGEGQTAVTLGKLARLYYRLGRYNEAEKHWLQALGILENRYGPEAAALAGASVELALVYLRQRKFAAAEPLLRRAIRLHCASGLPNHASQIIASLRLLPGVYRALGRFGDAEAIAQLTEDLLSGRDEVTAEASAVPALLKRLAGLGAGRA